MSHSWEVAEERLHGDLLSPEPLFLPQHPLFLDGYPCLFLILVPSLRVGPKHVFLHSPALGHFVTDACLKAQTSQEMPGFPLGLIRQQRHASLLGFMVDHGLFSRVLSFQKRAFLPTVLCLAPTESDSPTLFNFSANLLLGKKVWEEIICDQW